jgi:hypothetical protein
MSVPRELSLRTVDGRPRVVQCPVDQRGDVIDLRATLAPGDELALPGGATLGYDGRLLALTRSNPVGGVYSAPMNGGPADVRVLVGQRTVEVFAQGGERTLSALIA